MNQEKMNCTLEQIAELERLANDGRTPEEVLGQLPKFVLTTAADINTDEPKAYYLKQEPDGSFKYAPWQGEVLSRENSTVWRLTDPEHVAVYLGITLEKVDKFMKNKRLPHTVKRTKGKARYSFLMQNVNYVRRQLEGHRKIKVDLKPHPRSEQYAAAYTGT